MRRFRWQGRCRSADLSVVCAAGAEDTGLSRLWTAHSRAASMGADIAHPQPRPCTDASVCQVSSKRIKTSTERHSMKNEFKTLMVSGLGLVGAAILAACGGDGGSSGTSGAEAWQTDAAGNIKLQFVAVSGNTPIDCTSSLTLGVPARAVKMRDFRVYVSGVQIIRADGQKVPLRLRQTDDYNYTSDDGQAAVSLIDLEQQGQGNCAGSAPVNAVIEGTVPAGSYTGVELTVGVPHALNHLNAADAATPRALQNSVHPRMSWAWRGGRKFTLIEFEQDRAVDAAQWESADAGEDGAVSMHLGATGCVGNPAEGVPVSSCKAPNRLPVSLAGFNPGTQRIAFDAAALFNFNIASSAEGGGCHSGPSSASCAKPFEALALDWKADGSGTGVPVEGRTQVLVKAISQ